MTCSQMPTCWTNYFRLSPFAPFVPFTSWSLFHANQPRAVCFTETTTHNTFEQRWHSCNENTICIEQEQQLQDGFKQKLSPKEQKHNVQNLDAGGESGAYFSKDFTYLKSRIFTWNLSRKETRIRSLFCVHFSKQFT